MRKKIIGIFVCMLLIAIVVPNVGAANWTQMQKLIAGDSGAGDDFGWSVSLSGDTVLIGAYLDDDNGADSGSAYVYTRTAGTWTQQAKLLAGDGAEGDYFGYSVVLAGDTALIGAWGDDDNGGNSGSAYVFIRTGTTWTQQAKLLASDGAVEDHFGCSVSLAGNTALIGAEQDDDNGELSGSVYVFTRTGTTWVQQQKLLPLDGQEGGFFGYSISLDKNTALIGATGYDYNGAMDSGCVYVFTRTSTIWTQQAKLLSSDISEADNFGVSVSLNGNTALIGAETNDNGVNSGSAYVFIRTGTTWTQQRKLLASDSAADKFFGYSVSLSGDIALIGAPRDSDHGYYVGAAYVFTRTGSTTWTQQTKLLASDGVAEDCFGCSVSVDGNTALIGAFGDDGNRVDSGSAYVFTKEQLDQQQTRYQKNLVFYSTQWNAQSFIPTVTTLTRAEVYISKTCSPTSAMVLSIRSSLKGADLVIVSKPASDIPTSNGWVEFDFTNLPVTPGSTYYLVLKTTGGNSKNYYNWGYGISTPYTNGMQWTSANGGSKWTQFAKNDFCFKIYGI